MGLDVPWASTEVVISSKDKTVARAWYEVSVALESPGTLTLPHRGGTDVSQSVGLLRASICLLLLALCLERRPPLPQPSSPTHISVRRVRNYTLPQDLSNEVFLGEENLCMICGVSFHASQTEGLLFSCLGGGRERLLDMEFETSVCSQLVWD